MKVHYINILLFALTLNILTHNKNEPSITQLHKQTNRSLCECELYAPANYDNDLEMKKMMEIFHKQTSERFKEYDERMQITRQKCKDKCDKEIQKIILKDKLEKELMDKFVTLDTDIQSDAIPTCVCEKSVADKMEKGCLKCGGVLGGGVAPTVGLLGTVAIGAWKNAAIAAATQAAIDKGLALGKIAGDIEGAAKVVAGLQSTFKVSTLGVQRLESFIDVTNYLEVSVISDEVYSYYSTTCVSSSFPFLPRLSGVSGAEKPICKSVMEQMLAVSKLQKGGVSPKVFIEGKVGNIVTQAKGAASVKAAQVAAAKTPALEAKNIAAVEATTTPYYTPIIVSIVAIVIIVLIMVIIYKILRYRRKKKMKKKLQYIKLLEE
ncbi:rifin [Plasmodium reichenowi]|uniref:Rifin n=1 Tax=Plasmodium reichenowi TaxID=5854 RepID=A0A060RNV6_PLARE|nr:rifin [Plasmodium reichenowi]